MNRNDRAVLASIDAALQIQRYRPLADEALDVDGSVSLSGDGGGSIDPALASVASDPNWVELARQLALFKTIPGFRSVYLRRDSDDIEFAVVVALDRAYLNADLAQALFEHAWDVFRPLRQMVGRFRLSPEQQRVAHAAVAPLTAHPAMSVFDAALDLSLAAKSATGTILIVALRGLAFEEVAEQNLYAHEEAGFLGLSEAVCRTLVLDPETGDAIWPAHAMGSLDSDQFLRNFEAIRA